LFIPTSTFYISIKQRHRRCPLYPYTTLFRSAIRSQWQDNMANIGLIDNQGNVRAEAQKRIAKLVEEFEAFKEDYRIRSKTKDKRSEEHTSELQSREKLVCRLLLEKKNEMQTV